MRLCGAIQAYWLLVRISVHHFDYIPQAVLSRGRDCGKAKRLFRPGNREQHLRRPGHRPLGRNKYQTDHCTGWKERGWRHSAAGHGNALQLPGNSLAVLAAKDDGDGIRQLQPLRTPSWFGLNGLSHSYSVCSGFPKDRRSRRGWYCFHSRLSARPVPLVETADWRGFCAVQTAWSP